MSLRKVGKSWEIRHVVRKRFASRGEAESFGRHLESGVAEAARRHQFDLAPCCTIRGKLDEFLNDCRLGLRRRPNCADTLAMHRKRLLAFDRAFHSRPLDAISLADVEGWIRRRSKADGRHGRVKPGTINADLVSLKAFGRWAMAKSYAPANLEFMAIGKLRTVGKIPGANQEPPRALPMHEVLELIARIRALREDVGLLLLGVVLFCLRPASLCRLRRSDLKLTVGEQPGSLRVVGLKGGHDRVLSIPAGSEQALWAKRCLSLFRRVKNRSAKPHDPLIVCASGRSVRNPFGWSTGTLDKAVARLCKRLGIDFTPYMIRHSAISQLQRSDMSVAAVQAVAGHSNPNTQRLYSHRNASDAVPAFAVLSEMVAEHRRSGREREDQGGAVSG